MIDWDSLVGEKNNLNDQTKYSVIGSGRSYMIFITVHSLTSSNTFPTHSLHSSHSGLFILPWIQTSTFPVEPLYWFLMLAWNTLPTYPPDWFLHFLQDPTERLFHQKLFFSPPHHSWNTTPTVRVYSLLYFLLSKFYHHIFIVVCLLPVACKLY